MSGNSHLKVGRADTKPTAPAHVAGVREGNRPGGYGKMAGHNPDGTSTARRSTGIHAAGSEPIQDDMPNLSPA